MRGGCTHLEMSVYELCALHPSPSVRGFFAHSCSVHNVIKPVSASLCHCAPVFLSFMQNAERGSLRCDRDSQKQQNGRVKTERERYCHHVPKISRLKMYILSSWSKTGLTKTGSKDCGYYSLHTACTTVVVFYACSLHDVLSTFYLPRHSNTIFNPSMSSLFLLHCRVYFVLTINC